MSFAKTKVAELERSGYRDAQLFVPGLADGAACAISICWDWNHKGQFWKAVHILPNLFTNSLFLKGSGPDYPVYRDNCNNELLELAFQRAFSSYDLVPADCLNRGPHGVRN